MVREDSGIAHRDSGRFSRVAKAQRAENKKQRANVKRAAAGTHT